MIAKTTKEFQNEVLNNMTLLLLKQKIIQFIKMKIDLNLDILLNIAEKDIMTLELVIILFL